MSSKPRRRVTVESSRPLPEGGEKKKPSVFERLGPGAPARTRSYDHSSGEEQMDVCHKWVRSGQCPYGSSCKFSHPRRKDDLRRKMSRKREHDSDSDSDQEPERSRDRKESSKSHKSRRDKEGKLKSTVVVTKPLDSDDSEQWDSTSTINSAGEFEDMDFVEELKLEKRRQQLQRELNRLQEEDENNEQLHIERPLSTADSDSDVPSSKPKHKKSKTPQETPPKKKSKDKKKKKGMKTKMARSPSPDEELMEKERSRRHHEEKELKRRERSPEEKRVKSPPERRKKISPPPRRRRSRSSSSDDSSSSSSRSSSPDTPPRRRKLSPRRRRSSSEVRPGKSTSDRRRKTPTKLQGSKSGQLPAFDKGHGGRKGRHSTFTKESSPRLDHRRAHDSPEPERSRGRGRRSPSPPEERNRKDHDGRSKRSLSPKDRSGKSHKAQTPDYRGSRSPDLRKRGRTPDNRDRKTTDSRGRVRSPEKERARSSEPSRLRKGYDEHKSKRQSSPSESHRSSKHTTPEPSRGWRQTSPDERRSRKDHKDDRHSAEPPKGRINRSIERPSDRRPVSPVPADRSGRRRESPADSRSRQVREEREDRSRDNRDRSFNRRQASPDDTERSRRLPSPPPPRSRQQDTTVDSRSAQRSLSPADSRKSRKQQQIDSRGRRQDSSLDRDTDRRRQISPAPPRDRDRDRERDISPPRGRGQRGGPPGRRLPSPVESRHGRDRNRDRPVSPVSALPPPNSFTDTYDPISIFTSVLHHEPRRGLSPPPLPIPADRFMDLRPLDTRERDFLETRLRDRSRDRDRERLERGLLGLPEALDRFAVPPLDEIRDLRDVPDRFDRDRLLADRDLFPREMVGHESLRGVDFPRLDFPLAAYPDDGRAVETRRSRADRTDGRGRGRRQEGGRGRNRGGFQGGPRERDLSHERLPERLPIRSLTDDILFDPMPLEPLRPQWEDQRRLDRERDRLHPVERDRLHLLDQRGFDGLRDDSRKRPFEDDISRSPPPKLRRDLSPTGSLHSSGSRGPRADRLRDIPHDVPRDRGSRERPLRDRDDEDLRDRDLRELRDRELRDRDITDLRDVECRDLIPRDRDVRERDLREREGRDRDISREHDGRGRSDRELRDWDPRDGRDTRDIREGREGRETRDTRDNREVRDLRDLRDTRDGRDSRDVRDNRDTRGNRDLREPREVRDTRESREPKEGRDSREGRNSRDPEWDAREGRDVKDLREQLDSKDRDRERGSHEDGSTGRGRSERQRDRRGKEEHRKDASDDRHDRKDRTHEPKPKEENKRARSASPELQHNDRKQKKRPRTDRSDADGNRHKTPNPDDQTSKKESSSLPEVVPGKEPEKVFGDWSDDDREVDILHRAERRGDDKDPRVSAMDPRSQGPEEGPHHSPSHSSISSRRSLRDDYHGGHGDSWSRGHDLERELEDERMQDRERDRSHEEDSDLSPEWHPPSDYTREPVSGSEADKRTRKTSASSGPSAESFAGQAVPPLSGIPDQFQGHGDNNAPEGRPAPRPLLELKLGPRMTQTVMEEDSTQDQPTMEYDDISDDELDGYLGRAEIEGADEEKKVKPTGVVDALDIDWSSLCKATSLKEDTRSAGSALKRFTPGAIFARLGVSKALAGNRLFNKVQRLCQEEFAADEDSTREDKAEDGDLDADDKSSPLQAEGNLGKKPKVAKKTSEFKMLHDIALLHVGAMQRKRVRRDLVKNIGPHRRALCARRDLQIRRHLCKVDKELEAGMMPAQVVDQDLYKQSLALFRQDSEPSTSSNTATATVASVDKKQHIPTISSPISA